MQEFINLLQGGMSVKEYSLKFSQLSKHAPTMMEDSRAKINNFFLGISYLVVNECTQSILIPNMHISRLMAYARKIQDQKLKQFVRELKKVRTKQGILQRIGFRLKTTQGSRRDFTTKALLILEV